MKEDQERILQEVKVELSLKSDYWGSTKGITGEVH